MPDVDTQQTHDFKLDVPFSCNGEIGVRGSEGYDWGMRHRLSRIFDADGCTVMLAVDHGYFQGPTRGLERPDVLLPELVPYADALMCTRGILRTSVPANLPRSVVLRASGGTSVLKDDLSNEEIAMSMEDAVRLNAAAVAVQVFVGSEHEAKTIHNLTRLVDAGYEYGVPVMGVVAVGKEMSRDARYFRLACRIISELGAQIVKCYYTEPDFETVVASCPVPIVMAGGKKLPELEALTMASKAMKAGAAGVDMGRNIFQSADPARMIQAVRAVVHENLSPDEAAEKHLKSVPVHV